jgi:hypothetical protein
MVTGESLSSREDREAVEDFPQTFRMKIPVGKILNGILF